MLLENENVKIEYLANHGGKLTSIYDKKSDFELLFQNPKDGFKEAKCGSRFEEFECCGFDDAFPSINEETINYEGNELTYVDHGEIWSSKMNEESKSDKSVTLSTSGKFIPYHFQKTITLKDRGLSLSYKIKNNSTIAYPCFYTFHCLVRCEEDASLIMPKNTHEILMVNEENRFKTNLVSYPISKSGIDVSKVCSLKSGECEKFYVSNKVSEGRCGYIYPSNNLKLIINYDENVLPYLGFFNTQGGFRGDYNMALEMSNGFYDSVSKALSNNSCPILKPSDTMEFSFDLDFKKFH